MAKKVLSAPSNLKSKSSKPQSLRVLMVEDSEDDVLLIIRELKKSGYNPVYERVETATAIKKALQEKQWDIILCDYKLPKFNATSAIAVLKETNINIPLIIVSGTIGEETAVECMRSGARDYIMKNNLSRLCPAIARELQEAEVRNKQKRAEEISIHNEKRFKTLYQESPIPTFTWQKKGDDFFLADCNRAAILLTEGKASNYMGKSAQEMYRKRTEIIDDMFRCFKEQSTISKELVSQHFVPGRLLSVYYSYIPSDLIIVHMEDITERKRAEEELRESEERFRLAFENANTGVCLVDLEGNLTKVNNKMCNIFGYTKEELEHMTVNDIAHPEDIGKSPEFIQKTLHGKIDNAIFEKRYFHKKGQIVTCEVSSSLIHDAEGVPLYFISHINDITDRKNLQETLDKEREELKLIINASPIIVFYKDKEGRFIRVNKIFAEALNIREEALVGKTVFDFYSPQIAQNMTDDDQEVFQTRRPKLNIIEQYESASGLRWVQTDKVPIYDKNGMPIALIGFAQDITDRKQTEEALRESEENFHISLDNSPLGVRIATAEGETLYANQAVLDMYDYASIDELRKTPLKDRYTPESYADFQIRKKKRGRGEVTPSEYEISIVRKNGEIRHLQVFRKEVIWNGAKQFQIIYNDITERKQAGETLRESEEKYRNILESIEDGYYEVDLAGNLTFFNDSLCRINGYPREELMGMNNRQYTDEYNAKQIFQAFNEVYRTEKPATGYEYEVIRKDGAKAYIAASISLRKDAAGKKIGFRGIIRDITERKRAEEALRESEEKMKSIFRAAPTGIGVLINRVILDVNTRLCEMTGYSREELIGSNARLLYPTQEDFDYVGTEKYRQIAEQGTGSVETRWKKKDSTIIDVLLSSTPIDPSNLSHGVTFTALDMTERKQAQEKLWQSEEKYRLTFASTSDIIFTVDSELKVSNITPSVEKVLGYSPKELVNKHFSDLNLMTPESLERAIFNVKQVFSGLDVPPTTYEFITKDGVKGIGEVTGSPIIQENKIIGVTCVARDITERMRAEEKLLQSEEKYRSLVENAQEGIYQSAVGYLTLNLALAHMLGYDSPEEVMATITDLARQLYVNPDDRRKLLEMVNEKGSVKDFEAEYHKKDGSHIWVSISMHAVRDDQGRLLYYQGINQDITEKKKMEAERQENIERLRKSLGATINAMAVTVETRDPYTAGHQRRVADLARAIAAEMNLTGDQIDGVRMASMIHDIGKISIPSEILTKPTQLTNLEFNLIKTHPASGYNILKDIEFPWPIARIILEHHERLDGSGYPNGLKGEQILLESRIIAIADVVEAISSHRPYRAAQGLDAALAEISKNKDILYEPDIVDACLRLFREKNYKLAA